MGRPHISKQEIFQSWNAGQNTVKHHNLGEPQSLSYDRFGEAFMMIQRATGSADYLKLKYIGKKSYKAWLVEKKLVVTVLYFRWLKSFALLTGTG